MYLKTFALIAATAFISTAWCSSSYMDQYVHSRGNDIEALHGNTDQLGKFKADIEQISKNVLMMRATDAIVGGNPNTIQDLLLAAQTQVSGKKPKEAAKTIMKAGFLVVGHVGVTPEDIEAFRSAIMDLVKEVNTHEPLDKDEMNEVQEYFEKEWKKVETEKASTAPPTDPSAVPSTVPLPVPPPVLSNFMNLFAEQYGVELNIAKSKFYVDHLVKVIKRWGGDIQKLLTDRTAEVPNKPDIIGGLGNSFENFFHGKIPAFDDVNSFRALPPQLFLNMAIYNELHQVLSGVPYLCAVSHVLKKEAQKKDFQKACGDQLRNLYHLSGLQGGLDEIKDSVLPVGLKLAIQYRFAKIVEKILYDAQKKMGNAVKWFAKNSPLDLARQKREELEKGREDYSDGSDIDENEPTSHGAYLPSASPIRTKRSPQSIFEPNSLGGIDLIISGASSDVDVHKVVSDKIQAAIGAKKTLDPADFTPEEIKAVGEKPELVESFVKNVDHTKLGASKELLSKHLCEKAGSSIEKLESGDLRKAWDGVCGSSWTYTIIIIVCAVVLVVGLGLGLYFWLRNRN